MSEWKNRQIPEIQSKHIPYCHTQSRWDGGMFKIRCTNADCTLIHHCQFYQRTVQKW